MSDPVADASDIAALQAGENAALDRLMRRWQRPLQSYLIRLTGHDEDARDLAQETFVRVYRHRARFRREARFSTWLFQIALNVARDHQRHHRRRPTEPLEGHAETPAGGPLPDRQAEQTEATAAVRQAIAALPENLRAPLILAEYEKLPQAEIAQIIGTSVKGVETRLYRARDLLRRRLQRWL